MSQGKRFFEHEMFNDPTGEGISMEARFFKRIMFWTVFVLTFLVLCVVSYHSQFQQLQRLGYSYDDTKAITKALGRAEIETVLKYRHIGSLTEVIRHEDFVAERLENYAHIATTSSLTVEQIVAVGNHPDFDIEQQKTQEAYESLMNV